ncbi:hypothetical protein C0J52_19234, partial [Blattella germanica]
KLGKCSLIKNDESEQHSEKPKTSYTTAVFEKKQKLVVISKKSAHAWKLQHNNAMTDSLYPIQASLVKHEILFIQQAATNQKCDF